MSMQELTEATFPPFLYGTAWKEQATPRLVYEALSQGFKGLDTANQRKHYFEEGVGFGIQKYLNEHQVTRKDLFLQTKFTSLGGQDERLPYDPSTSLTNQVQQSFTSSLAHLQTDYIDSYVLHGPTLSKGIIDDDLEIWQAMESLIHGGKVRFLGISNVTISQMETLYQSVSVKPTFLQNRCFTVTGWDKEVREFCNSHDIIYQGFSLLSANQRYLSDAFIRSLAQKFKKTTPQIIFRFAQQIGILPLTGTTSSNHMNEDLHLADFELSPEEIQYIEGMGMGR
jgi:diketogulonate reductase-like aldo/keto reductase